MKNTWDNITKEQRDEIFAFSEEYKKFLDTGKTEREACAYIINEAKSAGFVDFEDVLEGSVTASSGLKIYRNIHNKSVILAVLGKETCEKGFKIIGSHIDSPRLDFKPKPFYEDSELGLIKTHYYGGIKKYLWVTIPLSIHGTVVKKDGTSVNISIGEGEKDPVFTISDLLIHLSPEYMEKTASKVVTSENMNILAGSLSFTAKEDAKSPIKDYILDYFRKNYGVDETELITAEFEAVPAMKAKDLGFDRSMVAAYGQDDRICAFTSLKALLDMDETPDKTCICYFSDKEEIGSMGNTGAQSFALQNFIGDICSLMTQDDVYFTTRRCLSNSKMLSADVTAGFDPTYAEAYDKLNAAFIGKGIALEKYTGARGKSGASDANAEYLAEIVNIFEENDVPWQINEMGKGDLGGGGTIAQYMANLGIQIIDCGVPLLSMHSPYEVSSKGDIYFTYKGYSAFYQN